MTEQPQIADNEAVYDEQIHPLMAQIIAICKEHNIPMAATFQYGPADEDGNAPFCTTVIDPPGCSTTIPKIRKVVYNGWDVQPPFVAITITKADRPPQEPTKERGERWLTTDYGNSTTTARRSG